MQQAKKTVKHTSRKYSFEVNGLEAWKAAKNALENVLEAVNGERILIICDEEKTEVGEAFATGASALGLNTTLAILGKTEKPRTEIPASLQEKLSRKPDIYINLLRGSREETPFRIKLIKTETRDSKARLGHCPGVTLDMLTEGALALTPEEHRDLQVRAETLMETLEGIVTVEISNPAGTNLALSGKGRRFITDAKLDKTTVKWINLPTGEVYFAPVEDSLNGKLVCDMAIGGIGKLTAPVVVTVKDGKAETVLSEDKEQLRRVKDTFQTDEWSDVVGEFAFGVNQKARFVDEFLEAEKILGTIHLAFGDNTDMPGGKNPSKNHMDMLISEPTVTVTKENGQKIMILTKGCFQV